MSLRSGVSFSLTEQQMEILYSLERRSRAAIAGCAGSGKTLVAVAKARELAGQGKKVLLTCFNKALATHWNESLDFPPGVTVRHFHGLCSDVVRETEIKPSRDQLSDKDYVEWLPTGLYEGLSSTNMKFDAVIVDEGQDFQADWFEYLDLMLIDRRSGIYYTFYDDNQRLYQADRIPSWFGEPYLLTKNVRNTNEVGTVVQRFYTGNMRLSGVSGPEVRIEVAPVTDAGVSDHVSVVRRLLTDLRSGGARSEDVVILTPRRYSELMRGPVLGGWKLRDREHYEGDVLVETVHSFKGQDASIIILTQLDDLSELADRPDQRLETLLYVGCSRARMLLYLVAPPALAEALPTQ